MTLAELEQSLRRKIGNPTTTDVPASELKVCINASLRHIMDRYPFHASRNLTTFPTVAGTKRYALPADLGTLLRVWNTTTRHRIHKNDMLAFANSENQDTTVQGDPYFYYRSGSYDSNGLYSDWIQFNPIPDQVYTIGLYYRTTIADLVLDADVPPIPLPWHEGIVAYARYVFYDERQDWHRAQFSYASWNLWVQDKPVELQEETVFDYDKAAALPFLRGAGFTETGRRSNDFDHED